MKSLKLAVFTLVLAGTATILSSCGRDCYPGSPDPACGYVYNQYNQPNNGGFYNPNQQYNPYQNNGGGYYDQYGRWIPYNNGGFQNPPVNYPPNGGGGYYGGGGAYWNPNTGRWEYYGGGGYYGP